MRDNRDLLLKAMAFLSIQAQDFIEDREYIESMFTEYPIPEHSSSGLH